jgi:hypothetical protein
MPPVRGERETRKQNPALWKRATTGSAADLLTPYRARFRPLVPHPATLSPLLRLHCPTPSINLSHRIVSFVPLTGLMIEIHFSFAFRSLSISIYYPTSQRLLPSCPVYQHHPSYHICPSSAFRDTPTYHDLHLSISRILFELTHATTVILIRHHVPGRTIISEESR